MKNLITPDFSDPSPAFGFLTRKELKFRIRLFQLMNNISLVQLATKILQKFQSVSFLYNWIIKKTFFEIFCGGENLNACFNKILQLSQHQIGSIPDYSIESANTEAGILQAIEEIRKTILISAKNTQMVPLTVFKVSALVKKGWLTHINDKTTKNLNKKDNLQLDCLIQRVDAICSFAYENKVKIMIDAEESFIQDIIDHLAMIMIERYNKQQVIVINTFQMYRKDGLKRLTDHAKLCHSRNLFFGVKLVRGAYMEKERQLAEKKHYPSPIHTTKEETDTDYNKAILFCLDHLEYIHLVAGTHNINSIDFLCREMKSRSIIASDHRIHISQLYGMGDIISFGLAKLGYNVVKYLPFGPVSKVMPYLMRRAIENSSSQGMTSMELQMLQLEKKRRDTLIHSLHACVQNPIIYKRA